MNNEHNSCDEILLSAYIDGEVTVEERRSVEDHVTHCASCAELAARMQHVDDVLRATLVPRNLHGQILKSLARESSQPSFLRAMFWGGVAAALLVSFGLGVWVSGALNESAPVQIAKVLEVVPLDTQKQSPGVPAVPIASESETSTMEAGAPPKTEPAPAEQGPSVETKKVADNALRPTPDPEPPISEPKGEKPAVVKDVIEVQKPKSQPKKVPNKGRELPVNPEVIADEGKKDNSEDSTATMKSASELPPKTTVSSLPVFSSDNVEVLQIELPPPYFGGTPLSYFNDHLEEKSFKARAPFKAWKGTRIVSRGKKVTSSDADPTFGKLSMITDGEKGYQQEYLTELGTGPQWVQVDLGEPCEIYAIIIWHFHAADRVYFDVVVQTALDVEMNGKDTKFNNDYDNSSGLGIGKDKEYIESNEGKLIDCGPIGTTSRYVRCYSNGNTTDQTNHYVEIEVWGIPIEKR